MSKLLTSLSIFIVIYFSVPFSSPLLASHHPQAIKSSIISIPTRNSHSILHSRSRKFKPRKQQGIGQAVKILKRDGEQVTSNLTDGQTISSTNGGMFDLKLKCNDSNLQLCQHIIHAFEKVAKKISDTFVFQTRISVSAELIDMEGMFHAECRPASFWNGEGGNADSKFRYPQALAKQIPSFYQAIKSRITTEDIIFKLNKNMIQYWYFAEEGGAIPSNKLDFEYIVFHELNHGLAFVSSWSNHFITKEFFPRPTATPEILTTTPIFNDTHISGFQSPTIYDKFIFVTMEQAYLEAFHSSIVEHFTNFNRNDLSQYLRLRLSTGWIYAENLWKHVNNGNSGMLTFKTKNDQSFDLYTGRAFRPGTSIIHFDKEACNSEEIVSCPVSADVKGVDFAKRNGVSFGPRILEVYETIGYIVRH